MVGIVWHVDWTMVNLERERLLGLPPYTHVLLSTLSYDKRGEEGRGQGCHTRACAERCRCGANIWM